MTAWKPTTRSACCTLLDEPHRHATVRNGLCHRFYGRHLPPRRRGDGEHVELPRHHRPELFGESLRYRIIAGGLVRAEEYLLALRARTDLARVTGR
jgi:hypothetical protein